MTIWMSWTGFFSNGESVQGAPGMADPDTTSIPMISSYWW